MNIHKLLTMAAIALGLTVAAPAHAQQPLPTIMARGEAATMVAKLGGQPDSKKTGSFTAYRFKSLTTANMAALTLKQHFGATGSWQQDRVIPVPQTTFTSYGRLAANRQRTESVKIAGLSPSSFSAYQWGFKMLGTSARNWSVKGRGKVKIGVIDTGLDPTHPSIKSVIKKRWSVDNTTSPSAFHGTHVASIIGADPTKGSVCGIAAGAVELYDYNASTNAGMITDNTLGQSIDQAVKDGVSALNISLGRPIMDMPSPVIEEAIRKATAAGILIVCAAGNAAGDQRNYIPTSYSLANPLVISVAALAPEKVTTFFSNYGTTDAAPGMFILAAVPKGYAAFSGTSMASPAWLAVAALVKYQNPEMGWLSVISKVRSTGTLAESYRDAPVICPNIAAALKTSGIERAIYGFVFNPLETSDAGSNVGNVHMQVWQGRKLVKTVKIDAGGYFYVPLGNGAYRLRIIAGPNVLTTERQFEVKDGVTNLGPIDLLTKPADGQMYLVLRHRTMNAAFSDSPALLPNGTAFMVYRPESDPMKMPIGLFNPGSPLDGPFWVKRSAFDDITAVSAFGFWNGEGVIDLEIVNYYSLYQYEEFYSLTGTKFADSGLEAVLVTANGISRFKPAPSPNDVYSAIWPISIDTTTGVVTSGELKLPPPPPPPPTP